MKIVKSLALVCVLCLLGGCKKQHSSAAFSSSSEISSSEPSSSSEQIDYSKFYNGYYDTLVSWTDGEDLKNQLHTIIRNGYTPITYTKSSSKQNYDTNIHADHSKYDFEYLDVIYSKDHTFKTDTNKGWQREHAWCASLMCGSTTGDAIKQLGRATDFHNLFAANASGNQSRGNKNYGYADLKSGSYEAKFSVNGGKDGYTYDELIFEPGDVDKGRLARAIFYMATMYKDDEVDTANNINMKGLKIVEEPVSYVAGNNCAFAIGNLSQLLEWNLYIPVDYLEMQHNISVYKDADNIDGVAQGNRNPYVDYPGLVDYVYGDKKNQSGSLKDVVASAYYLECEKEGLSHYALKEAKREYGFGDKLTASDYKVVGVNHDYSFEEVTAGISNSFDNHEFSDGDGNTANASITTPLNTFSYEIKLNPMGMCNSGVLEPSTTGINKKTPDVDQEILIGSVPFYFNFSTTYSDVSTSGMTINNNPSEGGGITVGSGPRVLTKLVLKTKNIYTFDAAFLKAKAGNGSSSYSVNIQVNGVSIYTNTIDDSETWKVFGSTFQETYTGQITFVFTGSSCLKLNSIAFNAISV